MDTNATRKKPVTQIDKLLGSANKIRTVNTAKPVELTQTKSPVANLFNSLVSKKTWSRENAPGMTRLFANLGGAFAASYPNSWQARLANVMNQVGAGQQQQMLKQGTNLTGIGAFGLTPEDYAAVDRYNMQQEQLANEINRTNAYTESINKQTTPEERISEAQKDRDLQKWITEMRLKAQKNGSIRLGRVIIGDKTVDVMYDSNGNIGVVPGSGGPRWKPEDDIPVINTSTRSNLVDMLYDRIKREIGKKGKWPFTGVHIYNYSKADIDEMIRNGNLPEGANPEDVEAYTILRNGLDISARADRADPALKQRVINGLSGLFNEINVDIGNTSKTKTTTNTATTTNKTATTSKNKKKSLGVGY